MWHLWHNVWSVFGRSRIIYHHFQQFSDISFINLTTMLVSVENPDRYNKMTVNTSDFSTSLETLTLEMVIGALTHISGVSLAVRSRQPEPFCHLGPKLIIFVDIHKCCLYLHVLFRHMGCQHYQWVLLRDIAVLRLNLRESDKNRQKIKPEYKLWGIKSVYSYKNVKL